MIKLLLVLVSGVGGAGAASSWILSKPAPDVSNIAPEILQDRLEELKRRFDAARREGAQAQAECENRLRHELAAFRRHPERPGTSSPS